MKEHISLKALVVFLLLAPLFFLVTSSTAAPLQQPPANGSIHVVQPGESLNGIALFYGVSIPELMRVNNLVSPDLIAPGQRLVIPNGFAAQPAVPPPAIAEPVVSTVTVASASIVSAPPLAVQVYTVQPGDTLSGIAQRFGTTVSAIALTNNLMTPDLIFAGQRLVLPRTAISSPVTSDQTASVQPTSAQRQPELTPAVCSPNIRITFPRQGEVLNGVGSFNITGTASIEDFQFYKLEVGAGEVPGKFASIDEVKRKPVVNGILLRDWNTGALPEGTYTLRLTVVDNRGQFPRPCDVVVKIDH